MSASMWRKELMRIAKCNRPEITPNQALAALLHIENLEKDLGAAKQRVADAVQALDRLISKLTCK